MIKSINDVVRDEICSDMEDDSIARYLSKLNGKKLNYVLCLVISDLFKIGIYDNSISIDDMNKQTFNLIKNDCFQDAGILSLIVEATEQFRNLDLINKSLLMKKIDENNKNDFFQDINKFHMLDVMTCKFFYELEYFKDFYIDYIEKNRKMTSLSNNFFMDKIVDLKTINYDKYNNFILEFIGVYYKWNLMLNSNSEYLSTIKDLSLKDIFNEVDINNKFLLTIIRDYLHYTTTNSEITEEEVNDFFFKNSNISLQKKLKIKR